MKLASLKNGQRDGVLVVVDRKLETCTRVPQIAQTLQQAIESWSVIAPKLQTVYGQLNAGKETNPEPFFRRKPKVRCRAPFNSSTGRSISATCAKHAKRAALRCRRILKPSR